MCLSLVSVNNQSRLILRVMTCAIISLQRSITKRWAVSLAAVPMMIFIPDASFYG